MKPYILNHLETYEKKLVVNVILGTGQNDLNILLRKYYFD